MVPDGIVAFFTSYQYMESTVASWYEQVRLATAAQTLISALPVGAPRPVSTGHMHHSTGQWRQQHPCPPPPEACRLFSAPLRQRGAPSGQGLLLPSK